MDTIDFPLLCAACQSIDRADGIEDGQLHKLEHYQTPNENRIVTAFLRGQDHAADKITTFAGSMNFVYLHTVWFVVWVLLNVGVFGATAIFDKFPFGLLTMIVSLEAIFLSTFVMVTQNRLAARANIRSDIDFENNLRSEIWTIHIGEALGIDAAHVEGIITLAMASSRARLDAPLLGRAE